MKKLRKKISQKNITLNCTSDTDLIGVLFEACEDKINKIPSAQDNAQFCSAKNDYNRSYENLIKSIKNLPPHFNNAREAIIDALDEYLLSQNLVNNYEYEYFYRNRL